MNAEVMDEMIDLMEKMQTVNESDTGYNTAVENYFHQLMFGLKTPEEIFSEVESAYKRASSE